MSKQSSELSLHIVFGFDPDRMPDLIKKDRDRAMELVSLGSDKLLAKVAELIKYYPSLGWRPLKAGIYVFNQWIGFSNSNGIFAEVKHAVDGEGHFVGLTDNGVYFCNCKDYQFNLGAIAVADGSFQQPCADIFAVALEDQNIYRRFVDA